MPALQRRISLRGPRFYLNDGTLMFVNHLDGSSSIGPRPATKADESENEDAMMAFLDGEDGRKPFEPLLEFTTPEGGKPEVEEGPYAARRRRAREEGVEA